MKFKKKLEEENILKFFKGLIKQEKIVLSKF